MLQQKAYLQAGSNPWADQVTDSPLNTKACVLKEKVFSLRALYFGNDQMFWECKYLETNEVYPDALPPSARPPSFRHKKLRLAESGIRAAHHQQESADNVLA